MIEIKTWIACFLKALNTTFGNRVWFVGLQGSYGRGEATEKSDVDIVVILDDLSASDVDQYNTMLDTLPHRERICGFLSGKQEIMNWEPADLFQFYYDTKPIQGSLDELRILIDGDAVIRAIKSGVCNIYHGCVHNMLYEKSADVLKDLYKSASFVMQAIYFQQTGEYITRQKDLSKLLYPDQKVIIDTCMHLKNDGTLDFREMSKILFAWSKKWINEMPAYGRYTG